VVQEGDHLPIQRRLPMYEVDFSAPVLRYALRFPFNEDSFLSIQEDE
jgi:hypothetical protein